MDNKVRCPFCGGQMIETENIDFKAFEEITDEMLEEYEAGEEDYVFYTMICQKCGAQSPQFDTEGEAVAFIHGFNERMRELS